MHSPMGIHDVSVENMSSDARKQNFSCISDNIQIVQSIITSIVNLLVFLLILTQPKLRSKRSHQVFINLVTSHICLSIVIVISELWESTWIEFYVMVVITNAVLIEMFVSLIICSADRLFAINFPFRHNDVRKKHVFMILLCSWIIPIIFITLSLKVHIVQLYMTVIMTIMIGVAASILTLSNLLVYISAVKHDRFVRKNSSSINRSEKKMLKASYVCLGIVSTFLLCWVPYFVHNMSTLLKIYRPGSNKHFTIITEHFAFFNSLLDPILFIVLSQDTRNKILELLKRKKEIPSDSKLTSITGKFISAKLGDDKYPMCDITYLYHQNTVDKFPGILE